MSHVVCVLGMHRSGTSLVSRLLNLLGVEWGPETLVSRPATDNPRGFWEHPGLAAINEAILERFGGRWDTPPAWPKDWATDRSLDDLRDAARESLARLSTARIWGWKDPRTCLTFPFWQPLFAPADVSCVVCIRNVADVARSLHLRNGLPVEKAAQLWLTYVEGALGHTAGLPRLLVAYERLMADRDAGLARLSRFCRLTDRLGDSAVSETLAGAFDDELFHHRSGTEDLIGDLRVPVEVKAVSLAVSAMDNTALTDETAIGRLTDLARQSVMVSAGPVAMAVTVAALQAEVAALESEIASVRAELEAARADGAWATSHLDEVEARYAALAADAVVRDRRLETDERDRARLSARIAELTEELEAIKTSAGWRLISRWRAMVARAAPPDSRRARLYLRATGRLSSAPKS